MTEKSLPLSGRTILLTRPREPSEPLGAMFREAGASVVHQPTVEIRPLRSYAKVDAVWQEIAEFDWLVFASGNGVRYFLPRCPEYRTALQTTRLLAIGPGTAAALRSFGLESAIVPVEHTAEGVVESLLPEVRSGRRVLIVRASRGREIMRERLAAAARDERAVREVAAYENIDVETPDPKITALLRQNRIDWTSCTSSAIAASLIRMFGPLLHGTKLLSIGPITSRTIREHGFKVAAECPEASLAAMFETVLLEDRR